MRRSRTALEARVDAVQTDAMRGVACFDLAVFHDNNGRETAAVPYYEQALALGLTEPTRSRALAWLASSLYKTDRPAEALPRIDEARMRADPELLRFLHGLEQRITASVGPRPAPEPRRSQMTEALFADFAGLQIQVGRIIRAEPSSRAKNPAHKLWINFGEGGIKLSSAQLTTLYSPEELVGRLVLAVTNFAVKQVADVMSEVLVLGVPVAGSDAVVLVTPDREVPLGSRVL